MFKREFSLCVFSHLPADTPTPPYRVRSRVAAPATYSRTRLSAQADSMSCRRTTAFDQCDCRIPSRLATRCCGMPSAFRLGFRLGEQVDRLGDQRQGELLNSPHLFQLMD